MTGLISGSRRIRQPVGRQQFAIGLEARFNPSRDSAASTIVMRLQREPPEYCFRVHTRYSHSWITAKTKRLSGPIFSVTIFRRLDESACNSNLRTYANEKEISFMCSARRFGEPHLSMQVTFHAEFGAFGDAEEQGSCVRLLSVNGVQS